MRTIGKQRVWSFNGESGAACVASCISIRKAIACGVTSYFDLATKIAELQFRNREYVLLFRGQSADHRNTHDNSTLKPSIFRPESTKNPSSETLRRRFEVLDRAEQLLLEHYATARFSGVKWVRRHQIVRWSILQHYEVCATPLLDVTSSLRIAASFASDQADAEAFVFVLGVPNVSGAITASAEAGLQIVRLSSVCPPAAIRPHIQEGFLLAEYPDLTGYKQKALYEHYEIDFGRRLIAKFRFDPKTFWGSDAFPRVKRRALYPSAESDPLRAMALKINREL